MGVNTPGRFNVGVTWLTHLYRYKRDASSHILKGQIKAFLCDWAHLPDLGVEAKDSISEVSLSETLIRCNGVHLKADKTSLVQAPTPRASELMTDGSIDKLWRSLWVETASLWGGAPLFEGKRGWRFPYRYQTPKGWSYSLWGWSAAPHTPGKKGLKRKSEQGLYIIEQIKHFSWIDFTRSHPWNYQIWFRFWDYLISGSHPDPLCSLPLDPTRAEPVVLVWLHYVANLEGVYGSVLLVHLCDCIPLYQHTQGEYKWKM